VTHSPHLWKQNDVYSRSPLSLHYFLTGYTPLCTQIENLSTELFPGSLYFFYPKLTYKGSWFFAQ
jgi:hypothetical protein